MIYLFWPHHLACMHVKRLAPPVLTFNDPRCKQQRSTSTTNTATTAFQRAKVIGDNAFSLLRVLCISFASNPSVNREI